MFIMMVLQIFYAENNTKEINVMSIYFAIFNPGERKTRYKSRNKDGRSRTNFFSIKLSSPNKIKTKMW